jgi:hypothetical protein
MSGYLETCSDSILFADYIQFFPIEQTCIPWGQYSRTGGNFAAAEVLFCMFCVDALQSSASTQNMLLF